ncbi:hypothetical protein [Cardiobacterium hominis]|uniref:hypothetical protein n=1 Tax=Cardiobacterium hominis TaxID=2718 RepID=UPI0028E71F8D|nr:hypothetical protein [Cardiobacterium hominis]
MENKNNKLHFSVSYDADEQDLKEHRMPADRLVEAIKEMNSLILQADKVLHGRHKSVELFVSAPAVPGSMGIEFILEFLNPDGAEMIAQALGLISVVGGLTKGIVKGLTGKKQDEPVAVYDDIFEIAQEINGAAVIDVETFDDSDVAIMKVGGKTLYCEETAARLIENPKIRKAVHGLVTKPVEGYRSPTFKLDNRETPEIEVELGTEHIQRIKKLLVTESEPKIRSVTAVVTFTQVNFDKPTGWKIRLEGKEVSVEVTDEAFLKRINRNQQDFRKSDEYDVELIKTTTYNKTGEKKITYTLSKAKKKSG